MFWLILDGPEAELEHDAGQGQKNLVPWVFIQKGQLHKELERD